MRVAALSDLAASFPTVEVEYEDLLQLQHKTDARCDCGQTDCLGIVLEIYRRAGLRLPDPKLSGDGVAYWYQLFAETAAADQLYDLIHVRRNTDHLWIVVRPGLALASTRGSNVSVIKVSILTNIAGTKVYRLRPECYP